MKKYIFIIVISIVATFSSYSNTKTNKTKSENTIETLTDNPDAPDGFKWVKLKAIKAFVLQPDGWFFNVEQQNKTYGYFITKEDYTKDPNQLFTTGFTLNALTDIGTRSAIDFTNGMSVNLKKKGKVLSSKKYELENIKGNIFTIQIENTVIQYMVVCNVKTKKVYIASFETTANKWQENEKYAKEIIGKLTFNQDF